MYHMLSFSHSLAHCTHCIVSTFQTGAENHQPVCAVNSTATDAQKNTAKCDRDEGDSGIRFRNAAQAYMEWQPIRRGPGTMGVVNTTSLTQVIEWGKLATIVGIDTRVSYRSMEPTLRGSK
jgi:alkaline phosphatase D